MPPRSLPDAPDAFQTLPKHRIASNFLELQPHQPLVMLILPILPILQVLPVTSQLLARGAGGRGEALGYPPRCVKTQLRRRVGYQWSKAHCTLHSLLHNCVYKILFEQAQ